MTLSKQAPAKASAQPGPQKQEIINSFAKGALAHTEQFYDQTTTLTTSSIQLSPIDIPAVGFLRAIVLDVTLASTGNSATVAVKADGPFSTFDEVAVTDTGSQPFVGPMTGYHAYLMHKYGGYRNQRDPKTYLDYTALTTGSGGTAGSGRFQLRIPIEIIARTGFGSLYNGNSSTPYRLKLTLAALASIFSTAPNGTVTCRIKAAAEVWYGPSPEDAFGRKQMEVPPLLGTTQYWTQITSPQLSTGSVTYPIKKVGQYLRKMIFEFRDTSNVRTQSLIASDLAVYMDTRPIFQQGATPLRMEEREVFGHVSATADAAGGPDTGVVIWDLAHDFSGFAGNETTDQYLLTSMATRLDLQFTATATTVVNLLVNDVSPASNARL